MITWTCLLSVFPIFCWQFLPSNSANSNSVWSVSIFQEYVLNINYFSWKASFSEFWNFLTFDIWSPTNEKLCFQFLLSNSGNSNSIQTKSAWSFSIFPRGISWYKFIFAQKPSSPISGIFYLLTVISITKGFCCSIHFRNIPAKIANNNLYM